MEEAEEVEEVEGEEKEETEGRRENLEMKKALLSMHEQ